MCSHQSESGACGSTHGRVQGKPVRCETHAVGLAEQRSGSSRDDVEMARALIGRAGAVAVLSGAGISTDSGIPDFRGPSGLWRREPGAKRRSQIEDYVADAEVRRSAWRSRAQAPVFSAQPNSAHRALVALEAAGRLVGIATQNVDGLHQAAGSDPERVFELHGSVHRTRCLRCASETPTAAVLARVRSGDDDPRCGAPRDADGTPCGGILQTATVSFGQRLDPEVWARARDAVSRSGVLVAVGTTLSVRPAAALVPIARDAGASIVIVNASPTALDAMADVVVRGRLADVLPAVLGL